ncbi:tryptophan 2,3-dioxygenase family protein [Fulvivirga sedimenti]|uniref:Tryptophan 2,3-dioxygenase n=1 Tax=Fulvivirga sedimenti TaxID=2879465 RepID=A0A9X1HLV9_9BACT|nr:tryptophan 2,3-dioxygenase family protein [Fulvivirga sedimenti]MCA6073390.1 tryptophan 2,3-dioxygenase [Fulvivirga sedimenti]
MDKSEIDDKILDQIRKLEEKYEVMGQDLSSYLDGLLYADYLTYWDYIHLDTLLSLQNPKTGFKDEMIFIVYHQFTELYFKLILWEMNQVTSADPPLPGEEFVEKVRRINRYFEMLENSFDIMIEGMDRGQFLKFRMSLLPSSGFQSAQYRLIEFQATDVFNLLSAEARKKANSDDPVESLLQQIYWKEGSTELASGKKTLTLRQFEEKYMDEFIEEGNRLKAKNFLQLYRKYYKDQDTAEEIKQELKKFDLFANVLWPLAHYKSAVKYLHKDPEDIAATGGTNWQRYLPPRFQRIIFFPEIWSREEQENWGKKWVLDQLSPGK